MTVVTVVTVPNAPRAPNRRLNPWPVRFSAVARAAPSRGKEAPVIDYKDVRLLQGFVSERGKIVKTESWGLRTLAYRIAKNRKAHYVMLEFEAPGNVVVELERQTQINEDIVRYMTLRVDAHEAGPSAMMRKSERSERGDRGDRGPRRDDRGDRGDRGDRPERAPRAEQEA